MNDLRCRDCGHRRLWQIAPLRQPGGEAMPAAFEAEHPFGGTATPRGEIELLLCAACGLAEWFARDLVGDGSLKAYTNEVAHPCAACGEDDRYGLHPFSVRTWSGRADVWTLRPQPPGRFFSGLPLTAVICRACERMEWKASSVADALESISEDGELRALEGACKRCGTERRLQVRPVRRHDEGLFHLCPVPGIVFESWVGGMSAEICAHCADVTWRGEGLDRLEPDQQTGVALLDGDGGDGPDQGPYR